jgi:hypothetical protein
VERITLKHVILLVLTVLFFSFIGCSNVSPDAVELTVDFTWEAYAPCDMGLPQMNILGIPNNTKFLEISMYDHEYGFDHGKVKIEYEGSITIKKGSFTEITGPCPPPKGIGRYKITVKALDGKDVVVGLGSKERYFPEKK